MKYKIKLVSKLILFCFFLSIVASCKKNTTESPTASIGAKYEGGIIGYILKPGDPNYNPQQAHGFIVAENTGYATWGCQNISLGNTSKNLGTGQINTTNIVNGCSTPGIAARLCNDLLLNGYSDWYLPSLDELRVIMANRSAIGGFDTTITYWSSSEDGNQHAATLFHSDTAQNYSAWLKSFTKAYRAVRSF